MKTATPKKRPSRKGLVIRKWKGGRTEIFQCRLTKIEKKIITDLIAATGLSDADWLVSVAMKS